MHLMRARTLLLLVEAVQSLTAITAAAGNFASITMAEIKPGHENQ